MLAYQISMVYVVIPEVSTVLHKPCNTWLLIVSPSDGGESMHAMTFLLYKLVIMRS